jgi:pilus assembly protein CpaB
MNTRAFSLALIIAGIAVFMVYTYIDDQRTSLISRYGTEVPVIVAKKDIKELELLDDTKVAIKTVPKNFAAPGVFAAIKDIENTMATVPIMKGEQITKPRITYPGAKTGLSRQVSMGKRAIAIQVTDRQAVSKLIKPGDRVDVLAPIDYTSGKKDRQITKTILQDILVLSTGMSMTNSIPIYGIKTSKKIRAMNAQVFEKYSTVALELTPYEAQKLTFLLTWFGTRPWLVLRNNNDKNIVRIKSTDLFDVVGEDDRAKAKEYFEQENKRKGR